MEDNAPRPLTREQLNGLPVGTIVRDMDSGDLGSVEVCSLGSPRKRIIWDDGCVTVSLGGMRVAANKS